MYVDDARAYSDVDDDDDIGGDDDNVVVYHHSDCSAGGCHAHATVKEQATAATAADVHTARSFVAAFATAAVSAHRQRTLHRGGSHNNNNNNNNSGNDDDDKRASDSVTLQLGRAVLQLAEAHGVYTTDELLLFVLSNEATVRRALEHSVATCASSSSSLTSTWALSSSAHTARDYLARLLRALAQHQLCATLSSAHVQCSGRSDCSDTPGHVAMACSVASLLLREQQQQQQQHLLHSAAAAAAASSPSSLLWCTTGCPAVDRVLRGRHALSLTAAVRHYDGARNECSTAAATVAAVPAAADGVYAHDYTCRHDEDAAAGGFRVGWVTEVFGEAGSGKTQLVLQTLLQQLANVAVADVLARRLQEEVRAAQMATATATSALQALQQRCLRVLQTHSRPRVCLYLAAEEVPSARLAALAAGALRRARARYLLCSSSSSSSSPSSLLTQLPSSLLQQLLRAVDVTLTPLAVLAQLHVKAVASLHELCALLRRDGGAVYAALRVWGGRSHGIVVVDSIAAAVARTQASCTLATADDVSNNNYNYNDDDDGLASGNGARRHVTALLAEASVLLRQLAVDHHACVLVVNQVRAVPCDVVTRYAPRKRRRSSFYYHDHHDNDNSNSSSSSRRGDVVAALGMTWAVTPHARVLLRRLPGLGRQLVLLSAPAMPPAQHSFVITADGIEDDDGSGVDA